MAKYLLHFDSFVVWEADIWEDYRALWLKYIWVCCVHNLNDAYIFCHWYNNRLYLSLRLEMPIESVFVKSRYKHTNFIYIVFWKLYYYLLIKRKNVFKYMDMKWYFLVNSIFSQAKVLSRLPEKDATAKKKCQDMYWKRTHQI